MKKFYDIHCHIFNVSHVPMKTILRRNGLRLEICLREIPLFKKDDLIRKYVETCEKRVIDILEQLVKEIRESEYTKDKEIILTPLLIYFDKEDPIKNINHQIGDIRKTINEFLKKNESVFIYPFLGVDPSQDDALELTKEYVVTPEKAKKGDFIGVKLYPPLNFNIEDKNSEEKIAAFFDYCSKNSIPITTHCGDGGCISKALSKKEAEKLSSPLKWNQILEEFPNLKVNFAHFGKFDDKWIKLITSLMVRYNNIYADISYSILKRDKIFFLNIDKLKELIKEEIVKDRILFGSDYYMCLMECESYSKYLSILKDKIGEDNLNKITEENPARFLGLSWKEEVKLEKSKEDILFLHTT